MTEHELTSLPGCVARYWNADDPSAGNHRTAQGLVSSISGWFCCKLTLNANLRFTESAEDCSELQPFAKPECSGRNCSDVVSASSKVIMVTSSDPVK
jgi:hypothetical protein